MIKPEFCKYNEYSEVVINMSEVSVDALIQFTKRSIESFYKHPDNLAGGPLHIVVDDHNYETQFLAYCLNEAIKIGDIQAILLLNLILNIPAEERDKLMD